MVELRLSIAITHRRISEVLHGSTAARHGDRLLQRHPAKDEGRRRGREIHTLRQAARGDGTAVAGLRARVGEGVADCGIDDARPALLLHGLSGGRGFCTVDGGGGVQLLTVSGLGRLTGWGGYGESGFRQQSGGEATDTARCAGDQGFIPIGVTPKLTRAST
jgi:hypothetical protein